MRRWYRYAYDDLDRITTATANSSNYNVRGITYDKNGNIKSLRRRGAVNAAATSFGNMDVLSYAYTGSSNHLRRMNDSGNDTYGFKDGSSATTQYTYDANGNMTADANKGITSISYNYLNLPINISINGGNIQYIYSSTGTKQRKVVGNTTTNYAGNFIYKNGSLQFFGHPEGHVEYDNGNFNYVYNYKDIWRNVRLSYSDLDGNGSIDPDTEILKERNFYPFGLTHRGYNGAVIGAENNYKTYQSQELTKDLGLNVHEWRYRISDPAIGRFWQIDPLAEKYYYNSPYAFQENKLGSGIELEGLENVNWDKLSASVGAEIEQFKNFIFNQIKYDMQTTNSEGDYHSATLQSTRRSGLEQNKYFADTREMVQSVTDNSDGSIQYGKEFQLSDNPDASQKLSLNVDIGFKEQTAEVSMPLIGGVEVLSKTEGEWKANFTVNAAGETTIIGPKLEAEYTQSVMVPIPGLPGASIGGKINAEGATSDLQSTYQNIINANNGNGVILDPEFDPYQR